MEKNLSKLFAYKTPPSLDYHFRDVKKVKRSNFNRSVHEIGTYQHNFNTSEQL